MPTFILICKDKPGAGRLRQETRARHLDHIAKSPLAVRLGGPILDDSGEPVGSVIIVEGEDKAAAEAFSKADPYAKEGVFESVEIHSYRLVAGDLIDDRQDAS